MSSTPPSATTTPMRCSRARESIFTTPGIAGAHEKGGVEGEVGRLRRNHLVPVPAVGSIAQLKELLRDACEHDLGRSIPGRPGTVAEQLAVERPLLRALPDAGPFDGTETGVVRVDAKALITVRQNREGVPVALAGLRVAAAVGAREIIVTHQDRVVARHQRLHGRYGTRAILDHNLELLARKPGGQRSAALAQERERGGWRSRWPRPRSPATGRLGDR